MYLTNPVKGRTQVLHHDRQGQPARAVTSVADAEVARTIAHALDGVERDPDDTFFRTRLDQLTADLPAAVAAALRAELERYTATGAPRTWTFFGHWEGDEIEIDWVQPGEHDDHRPTSECPWPEGWWCDSATGMTEAEAQERAIAPYETELRGECSVCSGTHQASPPGEPAGAKTLCWHCDGQPV